MKIFSTINHSSFLPKRPQEDYLFLSDKYPIFIVADGVTLMLKKGQKYPDPSGAGIVSEIFCKKVILEAEKKYENFETKSLKEIFITANKAVADYNTSCGRTKETMNYLDFDLFSATTALILIKNKKAYWWSLCDAGIILLDKSGGQIFKSPSFSPTKGKYLPKNWKKMKREERAKIMHSFRNKLGKNKEFLGYGVADGEKEAVEYLNCGVVNFVSGDLAIVYTDGFEHYVKLNEFVKIFFDWPKNLEQKLDILMQKKIKQSKAKYGKERSMIAILAD